MADYPPGSAMARAIEAATAALKGFLDQHDWTTDEDVARTAVEAAAPMLWQVGEAFTLVPTAYFKALTGANKKRYVDSEE
jgi:hypothetical protein